MSDYMFMLDSHLSSEQSRVVADVQAVAVHANVNVFLTGGAMRDMLGGFPIRELDFTVEGPAVKLSKTLVQKSRAQLLRVDEERKLVLLQFPSGVHASLVMARLEKYAKPGAKPQVQPATIHEDLRGRDFTINSIALSLNPASRGLLLDPNNGVGDLEHKELRAVTNYTLYDDPVRLLRLLRFQVKLGFTIGDRTRMQYDNAREAQLETRISPQGLLDELHHIANEPRCAEVIQLLDQEKLLQLYSPALTGAKVNLAGLQKLQKAMQMIPFGADVKMESLGLFLGVLTEKLTAKEKAALIKSTGMGRGEAGRWQQLDARAKKLERDLKSAKLQRPSHIYHALSKAAGDQMLHLLLRSQQRIVQDRIKNYLQKYLPAALEVTERDVLATGVQAGTPKYQRVREELISTRLDARPKKVPPPTEAPAPTLGAPPVLARK